MLVAMLDAIFGGASADLTTLTEAVSEYQTTAYNLMVSIQTTVVAPVAAVIISMMATLELARQSSHIDGDRKLGIQLVAATMFKLIILVLIAQNADLILGAINEATETIINGFADNAPADQERQAVPDDVAEAVRSANVIDQVGLLMVLVFPWLIAVAGMVILKIITFLRFMEIYILTAFATLPIAFMANPETKSIAVGYLRRYGAIGLQGAVLVLTVILFANVGPSLAGNINPVDDYASVMAWAVVSFVPLIMTPVAFIALITASGRIAKSLVGEG